jgi:O-methyltransferase domain/Dimerisation domain
VIEQSRTRSRRIDVSHAQAPAEAALDPEALFRVASGFMAAKHLFAASELGLFAALAGGPATRDELAVKLSLPARTTRIAADAMVALGFLEHDGAAYRNGALAAAYLAGSGLVDLRAFLRFWDRISYSNWASLASSLRTGTAARVELSPEEAEIFAAGVEAVTAGSAQALAEAHDFSAHRRMLDVGGGTGSFLVAALRQHPHLTGTLMEIEPILSVARERIAAGPLAARIDVVGADALSDPLPQGHDVVLVANVAHLLSPADNATLLRRLREASEPGARLLLVDFWTDATRTDPAFAALMAGEFALFSDDGDVHSEDDLAGWLRATGWRPEPRRPLAGPQSLIEAVAV